MKKEPKPPKPPKPAPITKKTPTDNERQQQLSPIEARCQRNTAESAENYTRI